MNFIKESQVWRILSPMIVAIFVITALPFNLTPSHAQTKSTNPHDYWFLYRKEIRDIRDFSLILKNVPHGGVKILDNGGFMVCREYGTFTHLSKYDKNKKKLWQLDNIGHISPNWKYELFLLKGDIWINNIDWETGKKHGKKQLTQLGVLGREVEFEGWYKNKVIFAQSGFGSHQTYLLNVETGDIEKAIIGQPYNYHYITSPDGRYLSADTNEFFTNEDEPSDNLGTKIYDFKTNSLLAPKDQAIPTFWIDDTTYITTFRKKEKVTRKKVSKRTGKVKYYDEEVDHYVTRRININDLSNYKETTLFDWSKQGNNGYSDIEIYRNDLGRYYSLLGITYNGEYQGHFFYEQKAPNSPKGDGYHPKSTYLFDENTGKSHLISEYDRHFSVPHFRRGRYTSVSKGSVAYSLHGELLTQGTFLLDLTTGEKKKITPYVATKFWNFKEAGYVLFLANNDLYRCDANGDNLTVLKEAVGNPQISLFKGKAREDERGKKKH